MTGTNSDKRLATATEERGGLAWFPALLTLFVFWLAGAYLPDVFGSSSSSLIQGLFGLFGLVVALLLAYPRRPRQLSMLALTLALLLVIWALVTLNWSPSLDSAWPAASTLVFHLGLAGLGAAFLTTASIRRSFPYLILASALGLMVLAVWRFLAATDLRALFITGQFVFPAGSPAATAGLYLSLFWPLMWIAIDQRERSPVRGAALGLAFGLSCLAYLAQSPAAAWAISISALVAFLLSPARFRLLFYLIVPVFLMVWAYPGLDSYWMGDQSVVGPRQVVFILIVGPLVCMAAGMILSLLERWIRVSDRMRIVFGLIVSCFIIGGLIYAQVTAPHLIARPVSWASEGIRQWQAAAGPLVSAFETAPWLGAGIGQSPGSASFSLRLAADLGLPGLVLAGAVFLAFLASLLWPRISSGWHLLKHTWLPDSGQPVQDLRWGIQPVRWGPGMHAIATAVLWIAGGTVDGQWLSTATSVSTLLVCVFALARVDAWAGIVFPRAHDALTTAGARLGDAWAPLSDPEPRSGRSASGNSERFHGFTGLRRAHRHLERRRRAEKRLASRSRRALMYRPPGPLSFAFQAVLIAVCLVLLALTVPMAIRDFSLSRARATGSTHFERAISLAARSSTVFPIGEASLVIQAQLYREAADQADLNGSADRHAAMLDNLALAISAYERAADADPTAWSPLEAAALELQRMAALMSSRRQAAAPFPPGDAALSLADQPRQLADCALLRNAAGDALLARARLDVMLALWREPQNPLLLSLLDQLSAAY